MTIKIIFTIFVFLLFSACSQSQEETPADSDNSQNKNGAQQTASSPVASLTTSSNQQVLKKKYRTVYQTINGQQMILVEVVSPLMNQPLTQIRDKADKHEPAAVYELARRYMKGEAVPQSPDKAIALLEQAAAAGNADAQNDLAGLYDFGHLGFPQDHHKAFELYRQAAKHDHPLAQYNLGACYYEGIGAPVDYKKSLFWTQKAADQGYLKATVLLGWHYAEGHGVAKNTDKAMELFHQAADLEEGAAFYAIGKLYDDGNGITQDYKEAIEWYRKGEKINDPECLALLGVKYYRGEGIPKNLAEKRSPITARPLPSVTPWPRLTWECFIMTAKALSKTITSQPIGSKKQPIRTFPRHWHSSVRCIHLEMASILTTPRLIDTPTEPLIWEMI